MNKISISVIIPTYNRADFIKETLQTITAQTRQPDEIIVVDDGSTDNTSDIVRQFDANIIYRLTENRGAAHARHVGVTMSRSSHVAFFDSDDLWRPDHLARLGAILAADPKIGFGFANFSELYDPDLGGYIHPVSKLDRAPIDFWPIAPHRVMGVHDPAAWVVDSGLSAALLRYQPIFPSAMLMSRARYDEVGGYNPAMGKFPSEDWEFTLRAVAKGPIGVITDPTVLIRKHHGNHSRLSTKQVIGEIGIINYAIEAHNHTPDVVRAMESELNRRGLIALDKLFASGVLDLLPDLAKTLGYRQLTWKQLIKLAIAYLPDPLAHKCNAPFLGPEAVMAQRALHGALHELLLETLMQARARRKK